ncbi:MAG TPA: phage tail assembly chaperone [Luteimonas sp.]
MAKQSNLRALATAPLAPFKHERVTVPEWENAQLVVRALTAGDWADYRTAIAKARQAAGAGDEEAPALPVNVIPATALVLVRVLFDDSGKRVLSDRDAADVAASFSEVHGRLVDKAFELSGIELAKVGQDGAMEAGDPVADAGNA